GVFETGFADYVQKLKQNGDIGHIGFSSHNPQTAIRAIKTGLPEMMLFSINPAFDMLPAGEYVFDHSDKGFGADLFRGIDPKRTELYQLCEQKQIGITVMKTLGAGKLISPEHTPFAQPLTVQQCMHYALTRPAVASVMLGCKSRAEVLDAMRYLEMSDDELDYAEVLGSLRNDFRGHCVYCSHCQPCPVGIDIATVTKYLDIARLDPDHVPPSVRSHYQALSATGKDCIACGQCEVRCPFGVEIIQNMAEAERLLG
ncbi:MAG: aldo/keto reductase, partial [Eubacteriales bacterium]|nr:aldo/keto reductase [Eubacteriales bacterium]